MKITGGMIVLNEEEFIVRQLTQHLPLVDEFVIVEGAAKGFPRERATQSGLSVDRTAELIRSFPDPDKKIRFVQYGWADCKSELRNRYATEADDGILIAFDCDEFLSKASFARLMSLLRDVGPLGAVRIPHVHAWKDLGRIVRGGYYSVPHNRAYRWLKGCAYRAGEHNHPVSPDGRFLHSIGVRKVETPFWLSRDGASMDEPFWWHMGFARSARSVADKNLYYLSRGEATTRPETTRDRAAWFADELPKHVETHKWLGAIPEVFAAEQCEAA